MAVSAEFVAEIRALAAANDKPSGLEALDTNPKVIAFVVATARAEGDDECDMVEALCRALRLSKRDLRSYEAVLRPLGYVLVADRLRQLARLRRCE